MLSINPEMYHKNFVLILLLLLLFLFHLLFGVTKGYFVNIIVNGGKVNFKSIGNEGG